jgi:hypothetical protein
MVSAADETDSAWDIQYGMKVLNRLTRSKHSWPFLEPVDPVALELEDYFEVPASWFYATRFHLMTGKSPADYYLANGSG